MGERDSGYFGRGFYFNNKKGSAQQYGDVAAGELDAGKVVTADLDTSNFLEATPAQIREKYGNIGGEELTQAIRQDGYNGVTVTRNSGLTEHVAFDVESIEIRQAGIEPEGRGPSTTTPPPVQEAQSEPEVDTLEKAGLGVKKTPKGWSVLGLSKEAADGIKAEWKNKDWYPAALKTLS